MQTARTWNQGFTVFMGGKKKLLYYLHAGSVHARVLSDNVFCHAVVAVIYRNTCTSSHEHAVCVTVVIRSHCNEIQYWNVVLCT